MTPSSGSNQLVILLSIMTVILAFVIWGMGRVVVELSRQVLEKHKKDNAPKILSIVMLIGLTVLTQGSFAEDVPVNKTVQNLGGLTQNEYYFFLTVIGIEIVTVLYLAFTIKRLYSELVPPEVRVQSRPAFSTWWAKINNKYFTKAAPIEKEADILLDHDYDGIRELDNALPPWWKYGFYVTILVAVIYLLHFHVLGTGKNPEQEYAAEMENARIEKEAYEAQNKDKVNENNVPMADATGIAAGKNMFEANCVACHMQGGAGNVGPNLTDVYWLHKGSLNDVYRSIKNGYPDKGMQAWSTKFNDKEISLLASYVKSLKGTNPPNAKGPQGDMYTEPTEDSKPKTDSAAAK